MMDLAVVGGEVGMDLGSAFDPMPDEWIGSYDSWMNSMVTFSSSCAPNWTCSLELIAASRWTSSHYLFKLSMMHSLTWDCKFVYASSLVQIKSQSRRHTKCKIRRCPMSVNECHVIGGLDQLIFSSNRSMVACAYRRLYVASHLQCFIFVYYFFPNSCPFRFSDLVIWSSNIPKF